MSEHNTEQICAFFDERAEKWDENDEHREEKTDSLLSQIGIRENDRVLDLGCGTGVISRKLYQLSKRQVYALDLSEKMILQAKKKGIPEKEVSFHSGDFYTLEEGPFDVIVIFDAYPHFLELKAFKESLLRNLVDGGKFAIVHDLGRKQLHDCHKGRDVSLLSRDLSDPRKEADLYRDDFNIIREEEGEDYYLLIGEKKKVEPVLYSLNDEEDRRRKKTRELLIEVFYSLLKEKGYEEITPYDIIRASKVSSSTFYSHFRTKEDIVKGIVDTVLSHVLAEKKKKEESHDFSREQDPESLLTHLFLHFAEDRKNLLVLLSDSQGKKVFEEKLKEALLPLMESFLDCDVIHKPGMDRRFLSEFLSVALSSYLILWCEENTGKDAMEAAEGFLALFRS